MFHLRENGITMSPEEMSLSYLAYYKSRKTYNKIIFSGFRNSVTVNCSRVVLRDRPEANAKNLDVALHSSSYSAVHFVVLACVARNFTKDHRPRLTLQSGRVCCVVSLAGNENLQRFFCSIKIKRNSRCLLDRRLEKPI